MSRSKQSARKNASRQTIGDNTEPHRGLTLQHERHLAKLVHGEVVGTGDAQRNIGGVNFKAGRRLILFIKTNALCLLSLIISNPFSQA